MVALNDTSLPFHEHEHRSSASPFIKEKGNRRELTLAVSGAKCGGCLAKIEKNLTALPGIGMVRMNLTTGRLIVDWTDNTFNPDTVIRTLDDLGYPAKPFDPDLLDTSRAKRERQLLLAMTVAGFAAANIMLLSVSVWAGAGEMSPETRAMMHWISGLIALPVIAYSGRPFFSSAWGALRSGHVNMDVPISLAILLSAGFSVYETANHGEHSYFDAAVMLLFFLLIGRFLEARLQRQTHKAADDLAALQAVTVSRQLSDGTLETVASRSLAIGDTLLVSRGERLSVDVDLVTDTAELNTSLVTGESLPVTAVSGARLYAGTINLSNPIHVRVAAHSDDSLIAEISKLLDVGEQKRSRYRQIADRAAQLYAPIVHTLAASAFLLWLILSGDVRVALFTAISLLVITCPCALALAAPVVQIVAVGRLYARNAFLKSGDALERITACDYVVFDKTGTLTELSPVIETDDDTRETLNLAAHLARGSRHPLSRAVVQAACPGPIATDIAEHKGLGLSGEIEGRPARLGNWNWVSDTETNAPEDASLWFWIEGANPVPLHLKEALKEGGTALMAYLSSRGIGVEICSGDSETRVAKIAQDLNISTFTGNVSPIEKAARIEQLAASGKKVLMVGDGLNDAGALASSHAALAPGGALDAARSASDCVYSGSSLTVIADILEIARSAQSRIKENFGLAIIYNMIAVPIAFAGLVTPLIAAIAMSGSSLIVTLNALRVRKGNKL